MRGHMIGDIKLTLEIFTNTGIHDSKEVVIERGVPQGSILRKILFVISINDLPKNINNREIIMYADYHFTKMLPTIASLKLLNGFSKMALFSIQPRQALSISPYLKHVKYSQAVDLPTTTHCTIFLPPFLGLHLDAHLIWEFHVDVICKKLRPVCYAFNRLALVCRYRVLVYFSCVESILRAMSKLTRRESCQSVFEELNIMTLAGLILPVCLLQHGLPLVFNERVPMAERSKSLDFGSE
ncbi:hypothetical protein J6590_054376 [Homalodisca vitripennis]|nr:hypothetical protein J6590_054376 [Homalodisca vitripennis]